MEPSAPEFTRDHAHGRVNMAERARPCQSRPERSFPQYGSSTVSVPGGATMRNAVAPRAGVNFQPESR